MTKEKRTMQKQQMFDFDAKPKNAEPEQIAEETSLPPPPFVRPDRQEAFDGLPSYEWPEPEHDRDTITVDRIYASPKLGTEHRFTIKRGDRVGAWFRKNDIKEGTVTGISHAKGEVNITFDGAKEGIWFHKGCIYPAALPEPAPEPQGVPLSQIIEKINQKHESELSDADLVLPPYSFDDYREFRESMSEGTLSFVEYQAQFQRLVSSHAEIKAELQSRFKATPLKVLAQRFGDWNARTNTKEENASSIHRKMMMSFLLDGTVSHTMGESFEEAIKKKVQDVSEEDYQAFIEAEKESAKEHDKALSNPETLLEFRTFLNARSLDDLSDSQLATYDALAADQTRERKKDQVQSTVTQFESDEALQTEFSIKEGYHDKKEIPLWIVQIGSRVERSTFNELRIKAKMLGGWYSSFKKSDAGFQFTSVDDANQFTSLLSGDADRSDVLERRKERRQMTAAERLKDLASELESRAEETIERSKESLQNTARRADMQASVRGQAYADQATAKTLVSISEALASGEAKYLDGIRHKTHLGELRTILYRAKWKHMRQIKQAQDEGSYAYNERWNKEDERAPDAADIRFAEYPFPTIYRRHLEEAVATCQSKKGVKLASSKMQKRIRKAPEYVDFKDDYDIQQLVDFLGRAKAAGHDTTWMQKPVDEYNRLRRAGIDSIHELRSALTELIPHIAGTRGDDPVQIAEKELIGKKLPGFFPTTRTVIRQMIELAEIEDHHRILEPSCGKGDILVSLRTEYPAASLHGIEFNRTLQDVLAAKELDVEFADFLQHTGLYDRILMNPPFENGQDVTHVRYAYELLAPGGRLVAIMGEGAFFRSDKPATEFREWLDELEGESEKLPEDAFNTAEAFRQTGVRTRLVTIDKPA